jgi:hypothetical protein
MKDLILWFSMMVMPTGPPALIIMELAELGRVSEVEKMAIAKALAVRYLRAFASQTIASKRETDNRRYFMLYPLLLVSRSRGP